MNISERICFKRIFHISWWVEDFKLIQDLNAICFEFSKEQYYCFQAANVRETHIYVCDKKCYATYNLLSKQNFRIFTRYYLQGI